MFSCPWRMLSCRTLLASRRSSTQLARTCSFATAAAACTWPTWRRARGPPHQAPAPPHHRVAARPLLCSRMAWGAACGRPAWTSLWLRRGALPTGRAQLAPRRAGGCWFGMRQRRRARALARSMPSGAPSSPSSAPRCRPELTMTRRSYVFKTVHSLQISSHDVSSGSLRLVAGCSLESAASFVLLLARQVQQTAGFEHAALVGSSASRTC